MVNPLPAGHFFRFDSSLHNRNVVLPGQQNRPLAILDFLSMEVET
jgi:hypothetical protein